MFPTLLSSIIGFACKSNASKPCYTQIPGYLLLTRGTSQIINKIMAMTSKIQRSGPAIKPIEKPSNHKTKRMIPIIKSTLSILTSFFLIYLPRSSV